MILTGAILLCLLGALAGNRRASRYSGSGSAFARRCSTFRSSSCTVSGIKAIRDASAAEAPVIYAVWHQSRIDPALMLSLLPEQTLHILDEASAKSIWLEPWRELARTITFNAQHVFVSRRLVRVLKGKGRLAVYFPDSVEPDIKSFRLFRAVARIAMQADARIVPIFVGGARHLPFSLTPAERRRAAGSSGCRSPRSSR